MSKALRTIAVIAGGVALIATGVGAVAGGAVIGTTAAGGAITLGSVATTVATYASVAAGVASVGAQLTAPKPIARGTPAQLTIEVEPPRPYIVGQVMVGGVLRHDVAYGPTLKKVPNPYRWQVRVLSGVGPIQGIVGEFFDFEPISSFYAGFLNTTQSLGARPQAAALVPPLGAAPGWDATSKLSGCAHVGLNFKFDKDGQRYASGLPIYTALCDGEFVYDPRLDSTFPGGSGPCRAGVESTYVYSRNPACHALTYALGRFQDGIRIFGLGQAVDTIDLAAIVDWANDCDANGWTVNMVLTEGGTGANLREQRVRNLDDLCAAGGARWYQAGGLLSFDWHRPRISLATLTDDDILEAGGGTDAVPTVRNRMNGVRPQYVSPAHNWQQITADEIVGSTYRTEDGEKLTQVYPLNGVTNPEQAGELAAYAMADSREIGPMDVQAKAKWRFYRPGDTITVDSSLAAYQGQAVINQRSLNPATMAVALQLKSETPGKHDFALGKVADPPPTPILAQTPEERDLLAFAAITPRAVDVEFDDGETVEGLKPSEPGATEGATMPLPGEYDIGTGTVGNIKRADGTLYLPGELLNTSIALSPSGRLEYRPLPGSAPVGIGQIALPDLGAASQVALRRAEDDVDALAEALATALDEASRTRQTFTDAGFYSDPATGQVRIHAVEQTRERVSSAEIRLNAAEAQINLRATVNYVDEAIATAVFDPSQIADLTNVFLRLTAAEVDIDGLNATVTTLATATELSLVAGRVTTAESEIDALQGQITTKVDTTTFNALETRVTSAESTLTAIGDTASIVNAVRSVRLVEREQDANAEADLRALLQGDRAQRDQVAAIAAARQELRTDIREGDAAEAVARLALQVRVGAVEASVATESVARISGQNALAAQITSLTASLNTETANRVAAVQQANQARIDGDALIAAGLAQQVTASRVADGEAAGQAEQLLAALLQDDKTRRETNGALAGARQEITAQVIEGDQAIAASVSALAARVAGNEASIVEERQARTTADQSIAQSVTSLNASFTTQLSAETTARIAAIAQEAAARQQAVTTLTASIQSEATARADADGALASQINTLTTTVNGNTASIATFAETINGLRARQGVRLDVNGRITGYVQNNDGTQGDFIIVADNFRVVDPDTGAAFIDADESGLRLRNGRVIMDNGVYIKATGVGFGTSGQFIEWFGPRPAGGDLALCTEAAALAYLKTNGDAYFGGSLSAGVIRNAARTTDIGAGASITIGPFGTNGNPILVVASYSALSQDVATYPATSQGLTDWNAAVSAWGATPGPTVSASKAISCNVAVRVDRAVGGGSPAQWATLTITGGTETLTGQAPTPGDQEGSLTYLRTVSGSITSTDNGGGTQNRTFTATITNRTNAVLGTIISQIVALTATEE